MFVFAINQACGLSTAPAMGPVGPFSNQMLLCPLWLRSDTCHPHPMSSSTSLHRTSSPFPPFPLELLMATVYISFIIIIIIIIIIIVFIALHIFPLLPSSSTSLDREISFDFFEPLHPNSTSHKSQRQTHPKQPSGKD